MRALPRTAQYVLAACLPRPPLQNAASPHMLAVMGQSADRLFRTVNEQLLRIFAEAEAVVAAGGQPGSRAAKYALNIMLQGMNVPQIAAGLTQVGAAVAPRAGAAPVVAWRRLGAGGVHLLLGGGIGRRKAGMCVVAAAPAPHASPPASGS